MPTKVVGSNVIPKCFEFSEQNIFIVLQNNHLQNSTSSYDYCLGRGTFSLQHMYKVMWLEDYPNKFCEH